MKKFIAKRNCTLFPENSSQCEFAEKWEGDNYYYISLRNIKELKRELKIRSWDDSLYFEILENFVSKCGGHLSTIERNNIYELTELTNKELDSYFI